jgi:hypothetical protein
MTWNPLDETLKSQQDIDLLPQYNVKEHTVTSKPWGILSVTSYLPSPQIDLPCYHAVHIGQCASFPKLYRRTQLSS